MLDPAAAVKVPDKDDVSVDSAEQQFTNVTVGGMAVTATVNTLTAAVDDWDPVGATADATADATLQSSVITAFAPTVGTVAVEDTTGQETVSEAVDVIAIADAETLITLTVSVAAGEDEN